MRTTMRAMVSEHVRHVATALAGGCAILLVACGGPDPADAGVDGEPDAGPARDAFVAPDAGVDAGPAPDRVVDLLWAQRVTSPQTLGGVAEGRVAATPDGLVLSLTTSGAPTTFGTATVGDATTPVTQAAAFYDADGSLVAARAVATADHPDFAALGYGVAARADGRTVFGGRFIAAGFFGGVDPGRVPLATTVEMPDEDTTLVAAEGYLVELGVDRRVTRVRRVASTRGTDDHRVVDVATLGDDTFAVGLFTGDAMIDATALTSSTTEGEVFLARWDDAGDLAWARTVRGPSTPTRVAVFEDGSSAVLLRYADALTVGPGDAAERTLDPPPDGTLAWDAVLRFEPDGALRWARAVGSDATTYPGLRDLRAHADGSVTVAGSFRGETAWPDAPTIPPAFIGGTDGLVTRIAADGELLGQTRLRALRNLLVQAVAPASGDDTWILLTVGPEGATFEPTVGAPLVLPESSVNARLVLLRLAPDGALAGAQLLASTDTDGDDLVALPDGDLAVIARYGDGTALDPGTAEESVLPAAEAERNVFVARYRPR